MPTRDLSVKRIQSPGLKQLSSVISPSHKCIALPLLQIVVVLQPLVQAVANKELYELANATVDGLHLVRLVWWHLQGGLQCAGRWIGYVEM